jgi:hypothetical protein
MPDAQEAVEMRLNIKCKSLPIMQIGGQVATNAARHSICLRPIFKYSMPLTKHDLQNGEYTYPCLELTAAVSGELGGDISTCSPYFLATELFRGSLLCSGFGEGRS